MLSIYTSFSYHFSKILSPSLARCCQNFQHGDTHYLLASLDLCIHRLRHKIKLRWLNKLLPICQRGCSHANSCLSTRMLLTFSSLEIMWDSLTLLNIALRGVTGVQHIFNSLKHNNFSKPRWWSWKFSMECLCFVSAQAAVHKDTNLRGEEKWSGGADSLRVCRGRDCLCSDYLHGNTQLQIGTGRAARSPATCVFCLLWLWKSSGKW